MDKNSIDFTKLNPSGQRGYITKGGYRVIYDRQHQRMNGRKKGDIYENRWAWEKYFDCCLTKWAEVHHIDMDKLNNSIQNLVARIRSDHKRMHWLGNKLQKKNMFGRKCEICGSTETYIKKDGWSQWFKNPDGDGFICRRCHDRLRKLKKKKK